MKNSSDTIGNQTSDLPACSAVPQLTVPPRTQKINIYRTIVFSVVLYGSETWSLTLRDKHKLRVFENRVLRRIFGPKRDEVTGIGENYITRSLMICTPHLILFR